MMNVGGGEVLVILLVALLVLGPDKLPEAARSAGKLARQVRQISSGFQNEIRQALDDAPETARRDPVPGTATIPGADAGPSLPPLDPDAPVPLGPTAEAIAEAQAAGELDLGGGAAREPGPGVEIDVEGPGASFS